MLYRVLATVLAGMTSVCIAYSTARAQPQKDLSNVDVIGLHLGMTANQVATVANGAIPNVTIAPRQGTLTSGPYTTPQLTFSEEISQGPDPHYGTWPDKEFLWVIFSMKPNNPVIYIDRQTTFSDAKAPTMASFVNLIEGKYGPPDATDTSVVDGDSHVTKLVYTYRSSVKYGGAGSLPSMTCENALSMTGGTAATLAQGNFDEGEEGSQFASIKNCGTWMVITIRPSSTNTLLTGNLEVQLGDLAGMAGSIDYMLSSVASNAARTAAAQAKGAADNKPKL